MITRGSSFDPWPAAERLGVTVLERALCPGHLGEYHHGDRLILLAVGMTYRQARSTLTHELQHAIRGDVPTYFGYLHAKQERQARTGAAAQLVLPHEYAAAESLHGPHLDMIARELGVDAQVVADWLVAHASTLPNLSIASLAKAKSTC